MISVTATFTGSGSAKATFLDAFWKAVGQSNVSYTQGLNDYCGVLPDPDFDLVTIGVDVFTGGSITGNICYSVLTSDTSSLVLYSDEGTVVGWVFDAEGGLEALFALSEPWGDAAHEALHMWAREHGQSRARFTPRVSGRKDAGRASARSPLAPHALPALLARRRSEDRLTGTPGCCPASSYATCGTPS